MGAGTGARSFYGKVRGQKRKKFKAELRFAVAPRFPIYELLKRIPSHLLSPRLQRDTRTTTVEYHEG